MAQIATIFLGGMSIPQSVAGSGTGPLQGVVSIIIIIYMPCPTVTLPSPTLRAVRLL